MQALHDCQDSFSVEAAKTAEASNVTKAVLEEKRVLEERIGTVCYTAVFAR